MRRVAKLACPLLLLLAGCATANEGSEAVVASRWLTPNTGTTASSGSTVERYFPLVDGMVYTYDTETELAERGMLVARVHRTDGSHGELVFPNGAKRFVFNPDGVAIENRGSGQIVYVLKLPLAPGASWRGEHGGTSRITGVSESIDVPAGHYEGCIRTVEERLGDRPVKYSTTFCPEVGVVELEAGTGANFERAVLKSYAQPLRMREDGRDRLPIGTPDFPVQ